MEPARLTLLENVCCLDCGKEYAKPAAGGTLSSNPGCPHCGYVGWVPRAARFKAPWPRDRFAVDRRLRRGA